MNKMRCDVKLSSSQLLKFKDLHNLKISGIFVCAIFKKCEKYMHICLKYLKRYNLITHETIQSI